MYTSNLKPRAKRLRAAVAGMFNVPVTHSQALELVAREENYPNWDAANASLGNRKQDAIGSLSQHNIQVKVERDKPCNLASVFAGKESIVACLNHLMDTSDWRGTLVLIAGQSSQGKSVTANVVMGELGSVAPRLETQSTWQMEEFQLGRRLKLMDEIRDERDAFKAVSLAQAGVKVVATIHATQGEDRLRVLLRQYGAGEFLLDSLIEHGRVILIHQELVWAHAEMEQQYMKARRDEWDAVIRAAVSLDPEFVFQRANN